MNWIIFVCYGLVVIWYVLVLVGAAFTITQIYFYRYTMHTLVCVYNVKYSHDALFPVVEQIAGVVNTKPPTCRCYCTPWAGAVRSSYLLRSPFLSHIPLTGGSRGKCSFCCIEHAALWPRKILQNPWSWDTYQVKLANIPQAGVRRTSGGGWRGAQ